MKSQPQRRHKMAVRIKSDRDLTKVACRRVSIQSAGEGEYLITSTLLFFRSEFSTFVYRYLRRKLPGMKYVLGNCSKPYGYLWDELPET